MSTTQHETTTPNYLKETSAHGAYTLIITAKPVPTQGYKTTPNQITYEVVAGIQSNTHATRNLVSLEVTVEIPNKNPEKLRNVSLLLAKRASGLLSQSDNKAYAENVAISAEQTSTSYTRYGILDAQVNESTENKKNSKKKLGAALSEGLQGYADALSRDWGNLTPAPASFVTAEQTPRKNRMVVLPRALHLLGLFPLRARRIPTLILRSIFLLTSSKSATTPRKTPTPPRTCMKGTPKKVP